MQKKVIRHGNHTINDDTDGYMYSFNTTKGSDFSSHMHKCYEFIHIIHGQILYTVEGTEYMLSDGDLIMTKPEELHSFSFPAECDYQREFLHIYPGFLRQFPRLIEDLNSRQSGYFNRFSADTVRKYGIDKIFREIEKCCQADEEDTDFLVFTYSLQLITKINQVLRKEVPERQEIVLNKKTNIICDYIDLHYKEDMSLESISNKVFMSPSYVSRSFKKQTGMTIKTYINMRRITAAKNLIVEGGKSTNIYTKCGFSDYSTFYRAFVKYVGMSPEEFRHSHNAI